MDVVGIFNEVVVAHDSLLAVLRRLRSSVDDYVCEISSMDLFGSFSISDEENVSNFGLVF